MIEELKCDSNAGFKLIPAFEVVVSRNKVTVDLGTLTDEYEKEITIHTTATDKKTGEKMIVAGKDIKIVDKVTLDGLEVGTKYKLSGWQMLKEENAELLIDGKRVDSDYTFSADSEKMTIEITYSFDGSALGGQNLVTFEELYDISNPKEPVKVVEHKDINDDGQTGLITERIITILYKKLLYINLEFAGENTTEPQRINGVWLSLTGATICIPMCREPMMLSLCFLPKLAKNISRRSRKSNLSTHESLPMVIKSGNVDLSITSYLQTICYQ